MKYKEQVLIFSLLTSFFCFLVMPASLDAQIYKYIDKNGNVVFTDDISKIPEEMHKSLKIYKNGTPNSPAPIKVQEKKEKGGEAGLAEKAMELFKARYGAKEPCPEETEEEIERAIKKTWGDMVPLLREGNVDEAMNYFGIFIRDQFRRRFFDFTKEKFDSIFKGMKDLKVNTIKDRKFVSCSAIRGSYSYPVTFIKDIDCVWRVYGF